MRRQLKRWGKLTSWGWEILLAYYVIAGFAAVAFFVTLWTLRKIWTDSTLLLVVLMFGLGGAPAWACLWAAKKFVLRAPWRAKRYARVFLICVLIAWITSHIAGQWMLRRELTAWRAAEYRASLSDYVSRRLMPEQNAAAFYRRAMEKHMSVPEVTDFIDSLRTNDIARASDLLAASPVTREALADTRAGSRIAECDWGPIDYGDILGNEATKPAGFVRGLAERLEGDARVAARNGDRHLALEDIAADLRVATHARQSIVIFRTMCAPSITSAAASAMKDSLRGDEEKLDELEPMFASLEIAPVVLHCSREENALAWDRSMRIIENPRALLAVLSFDAWNHWVHLRYLRERDETRSTLPMREWPQSPPLPWWAFQARIASQFSMGDSDDMIHQSFMVFEANRRQAVLAIRLGRYRRQHSEYPATLVELGASLNDPFTETAMKYERTRAGGFKLTAGPETPAKAPIVWEWPGLP